MKLTPKNLLVAAGTFTAAIGLSTAANAAMICEKPNGANVYNGRVSSSDQGVDIAERLAKRFKVAIKCCIQDADGARYLGSRANGRGYKRNWRRGSRCNL